MRQRWVRVGGLAAVLFALSALGRLVARFRYGDGSAGDLAAQERLGQIGYVVTGVAVALAAGWWIRSRPQSEVGAELTGGVGLGGLLAVIAGAFLSEPPRFIDGVGGAIIKLTVFWAAAAVGAIVGVLIMIAMGRDYRSRELRRFAEAKSTRPHRPVRR